MRLGHQAKTIEKNDGQAPSGPLRVWNERCVIYTAFCSIKPLSYLELPNHPLYLQGNGLRWRFL